MAKGIINMELIEAIRQRRSIRAFTPEPVPKDVIKEILSDACWAPSAMNTQPWEFVVVTGEKLDLLRTAIVDKLISSAAMRPNHCYPDPDFPANHIRSEREPAVNLTTWVE